MSDYISREAALVAIKNLYPGIPLVKINIPKWHENNKAYMECELAIENLPAADVQEVRRGEWFISVGKDGIPVGTICPICGFAWSEAIDAVKLEPCMSLIKTPYCPNCGAKMEEQT